MRPSLAVAWCCGICLSLFASSARAGRTEFSVLTSKAPGDQQIVDSAKSDCVYTPQIKRLPSEDTRAGSELSTIVSTIPSDVDNSPIIIPLPNPAIAGAVTL